MYSGRTSPALGNNLLSRDRRGTVLLMTAIVMPACIGVMALAIDVSSWEMQRAKLQQLADMAALAGSVRYSQTGNASAALAAAANLAELNGVPAGARATSGTTLTDDYGDWVTTYSFSTGTARLTATIQTSAPVWFGRLYTSATKQLITATAVAQTTISIGGHPCVVAIKGDTTGVITFVDLTFSGNTSVNSSTCGVRSDGGLSVSGNSSIAVPTVITSGSMTVSGNASITCPQSTSCAQSGAPQVEDPFSSAYGDALNIPAGGQSSSQKGNTYSPGVYSSSLSFSANSIYTLNPGVYYVNGSISISGGATLSGTGVTLISSEGISMSGNSSVNLTAPSTGATAGLLFGTSTNNGAVAISGNSSNVLNGAVYAPNANVTLSGNSSATASSPSSCFEIVGATVSFTGNSAFTNASCDSLGVPTLYNSPPVAKLIQ